MLKNQFKKVVSRINLKFGKLSILYSFNKHPLTPYFEACENIFRAVSKLLKGEML